MHTDSKTRRFPLGTLVPAVLSAAAVPFVVFAQEDDEYMNLKVENPVAVAAAPSGAVAAAENAAQPAPPKGAFGSSALDGAPAADSAPDEAKTSVFFTQGLWDKHEVPTPEEADGKTLMDAMEEIAAAAGKRLVPLGTNVLPYLADAYRRPKSAGTDEEYAELLRTLLPDEAVDLYIDMAEDSNRVYVGLAEEIDRRRTDYDVRKLARNHTRIGIVLKDVTLYDAVLKIADLSKANILTSYMEPDDQVTEVGMEDEATPPPDAAQIAAPVAESKASKARRVTYSTQGEAEWRTVLRSVLEPDYAFDERDGMVRVATKERFRKMAEAERDAVRMEMRYVRVYHANPEDIVDKLVEMKVTENANAKIQVAPYQEGGGKGAEKSRSYRRNLSSSSSSLSTGNTKIGESGSASSGSWGNLLRPKNPPAILLYDNPSNLDRLEALVKKLDVREKQVLIEAMLLSLKDNGVKKLGMHIDEMGFSSIPLLGVNWQKTQTRDAGAFGERAAEGGFAGSSRATMVSGDGSFGLDYFVGRGGEDVSRDRVWTLGTDKTSPKIGSSFTDLIPNEGKPDRDAGSLAVGETATMNHYMNGRVSDRLKHFSAILGPLDFNFILDLVEEKGNGKVLSSPVVTIGDHSEAMVHVGNIEPIAQVETTIVAGGVNNAVAENIEWYELVTGVMMWVGPEVTEDGKSVRLWVHPKVSTVNGSPVTVTVNGNEVSYPRLKSEELDTRVTVPSGGTLLLGGLVETSSTEILKKVPLLGDIPLLGRLFRWHSTETTRDNLVILIRPTILDDEAPTTEFEEPAMKIVEPMMQGSGRTLVDVAFTDENDPMKRRENAVLEAVGLKKKDDSSATADTAAEGADDTEEATADAVAEEADAVEEPSVSIKTTEDADDTAESAAAVDDLSIQ